MATDNVIVLKGLGTAAGVPQQITGGHASGLVVGELAVNTAASAVANRGHVFMGVSHTTSANTTNISVGSPTTEQYRADQEGGIVWVGAPILNEDDMSSDSDVHLATQQSVKAYVDTATASNRDIDGLGALGGTGVAQGDYFLISDNGTEKKITASNLEDWIFGNVSSDISIAAGGAATIGATKVTGAMLNDDAISGQDAIGGAPANSDELLLSDGGVLKSLTIANLAASAEFASGVPTTITVADESSDTTCFPLFATAVTGDLGPKTGTNLTFNSSTGALAATSFSGNLSGSDIASGTVAAARVATLNQDTSGTAAIATTVTLTDEGSDTTCFPVFAQTATGNIAMETDASALTYNSGTSSLAATTFVGALTGDASGSSGSCTGNAATATALASGRTIAMTGDVAWTSPSFDGSGNVTAAGTIQANAVEGSMLNTDVVSAQTALTSGLASTDELMVSDAGTLKRMDTSVLQSYLQSNLTFTTNTDADVTNANLLTKLAALESSSGASDQNITIGTDSGDTIVITGNLQVSGTTTTVDSTTVNLNDHNVVLDSGNSTSAVIDGAGITLEGGSGDDATFTYSTTGPQFEMKLGSSYEDLEVAKLTAASLDIEGNVDVNGTMEADAYTVDGATLQVYVEDTVGAMLDGTETNIAVSYDASNNNLDFVVASDLDTSGNAATATLAATSTVVDAAAASTTYYPALVDGLTGAQALEAESGFTFVGNTGILSATGFSGSGASLTSLNGSNISSGTVAAARVATLNQNTTGTAATVTTAAQPAITSLGTLTSLAVDNITINGNDISSTAGTDLTITPLGGQQIVLDGTIIVDAGVVTGATSITSTSFVGALTGQASTVATITGLAPDTATTQATQGAITSAANLATVGTIGTGVWNGTKIASAYLDDDTCHLSVAQTLSSKTIAGGAYTAAA